MNARRLICVALVVSAVCGCELVFTASPFSFLARDPSTLAPAALLGFADDALLSGDRATMQAAYDAMLEQWDALSDDPEAAYVAGRLALELSGMGDVVDLLLRGELLIFSDTALADIEAAVSAMVPDLDLAVAAARYLEAADQAGAVLQGSDYILGAFGFFLGGCAAAGGVEALDEPESWSAEALDLVQSGVALLDAAADLYPADDPGLVFVGGFQIFYEQYTSS